MKESVLQFRLLGYFVIRYVVVYCGEVGCARCKVFAVLVHLVSAPLCLPSGDLPHNTIKVTASLVLQVLLWAVS